MRISTKTQIFENLVLSWWSYSVMFRRYGLVGESRSMPLAFSLRFQAMHYFQCVLSAFPLAVQDMSFQLLLHLPGWSADVVLYLVGDRFTSLGTISPNKSFLP